MGQHGEGCVQEARGLHLLQVMPAVVRSPNQTGTDVGKLNICRPWPSSLLHSETTRWTDGQKAGVFLERTQWLGLARGRGVVSLHVLPTHGLIASSSQ